MPAAIDNTFLTLLLNPSAKPPMDPNTNQPVQHCRQRIEGLIDELAARNDRLIVPVPCLGEVLCVANAPESYVDRLNNYSAVELVPYDGRSAWEFAAIIRGASKEKDKLSGEDAKWQYTKIDRMIVAIAKAHGADTFYSDDRRQRNFAERAGLRVVHVWELDIPASRAQRHMSEEGDEWPIQSKPRKLTASSGSPAS